MSCPVAAGGTMSSAGSSSIVSGPPSVVINEPRDEALIKWLKDCRIDSDSIEKVSCCVILYKAFQVHVCVNSELGGTFVNCGRRSCTTEDLPFK